MISHREHKGFPTLRHIVCAALAACALGLEVFAQDTPEPAANAAAFDALERGTPRRAVVGFLRAFEAGDYATAAQYLDLRDLPPRYRDVEASALARQLGVVFSREVWINPSDVSDDPAGAAGDGLPSDQDRLAVFRVDTGDVALLLQRVPREDGVLVWKISNATVARTADLYADFGYGPIVERVATALPAVSLLGVELFKWVLALGGGLLVYAGGMLGSWIIARLWTPRRLSRERLFAYLRGPVSLILAALVTNSILYDLGLGVTARSIAEGRTVLIILATWFVLATMNLVRDGLIASLRDQRRDAAVVIQRPIFGALKIVIVITAAVTWLDNIGYNVTTLLASLGIGGIAVALALQKPLEDVFGAFTLYNQQPVRIGDFCRFGDKLGTVEEIGLRTTRIRTLGNTVISVPNAKIAGEYLENFSARQKILYNPTLRLKYDTPPEVVQRVLRNVRSVLEGHPRVLPQDPRVHFVEIGANALELEIFAYLNMNDWSEYLAVAEELNMQLLESIAEAGARLALPTQSLILEQGLAAAK